jgi:hypothetical protein
MIGSLRGWTHFRPLLTTQRRILRSIILAVNTKIREKLEFLNVLSNSGKVTVRLLSALVESLFRGLGIDYIVRGHRLMYIGPLVLGKRRRSTLNNES